MKPRAMRFHPITVIRGRLGLPRGRFAVLCGVTRLTVLLAETGRIREPRKLLDAIGRLGLRPDVDALAADCRQWAEDDAARLAADLGLSVTRGTTTADTH